MPVPRRKVSMLCTMMILNIFICILMGVSWNLRHVKSASQKVQAPSERFMQRQILSKSFWNKEQQRLDFIYKLQ